MPRQINGCAWFAQRHHKHLCETRHLRRAPYHLLGGKPRPRQDGLLDVFSNRILPGGRRGFFHPDSLRFGEGIFLSKIVATAQAVAGVECVNVTRFQRCLNGSV
jgi:hypothetical protein